MKLEQKGQMENAQGLLQPITLVGASGHNPESWRKKIYRSSLVAFSMLPVTNWGEGWGKASLQRRKLLRIPGSDIPFPSVASGDLLRHWGKHPSPPKSGLGPLQLKLT